MEMEHIFTSNYPDLPAFPAANFFSNLFQDWDQYENLVALVCGYTEREVTFKQLRQQIEKWCGYFSTNYPKQTIIGMICPNTVEAAVCIMGMMAAGMIFTGINKEAKVDEISQRLDSLNIQDVIIHKPHQKRMEEAIMKTGRKFSKIFIGCDGIPMENGITSSDIMKDVTVSPRVPVEVDIEDTICIIHSSGSTGLPKAMLIPHRSFNYGCKGCNDKSWNHMVNADDHQVVCYANQKLSHTFGFFWILICSLQIGHKVIIKHFEEDKLIEEIEHFKISCLHMRPGILRILLTNSLGRRSALNSLKSVITSGLTIPSTLIEEFKKEFTGVKLQNTYSMSECMGIAGTSVYDEVCSASLSIMNNVKVKVIDLDSGKSLPANCKGEILFKNDAVFSGYLNNEEANSKFKAEDGFYRTGDVGMVDENNRVIIIDRIKQMIKPAMQTVVFPAEVEEVLMSHPGVAGACVVGVPHPDLVEVPRAFVVLKDSLVTKKALHQLVADKLIKNNELVGGIVFLEALPFMSSGKVDRIGLRNYSV